MGDRDGSFMITLIIGTRLFTENLKAFLKTIFLLVFVLNFRD